MIGAMEKNKARKGDREAFKDQIKPRFLLPESNTAFWDDGNVPYLLCPIQQPLIICGY